VLLEARGIDVRYGRNRAVKSVDLDVDAGEIVTVLGANGAGKTSLLRALQGAVRASGTLRFDGMDIGGASNAERVRRGLVLVPEGRQIFVSMSVHDNLLLGAHFRRDDGVAGEIDAIYDRFPNLARRRDRAAFVLSGGEQQMLAIGRALLARPRLMMLDEPSLGLSPLLVGQLFDLLRGLNRDGLALLIVEQNTHMALNIASRGIVLELGTLALSGDAASLAANPALAASYLGKNTASDGTHARTSAA
jgi:branched-chain amino acid transport system ATP-binding protein